MFATVYQNMVKTISIGTGNVFRNRKKLTNKLKKDIRTNEKIEITSITKNLYEIG